jgi:hypothetical protein
MALPFWSPIYDMLPDGGIYDPNSGLSYIGPGMQVPVGVDVPDEARPFLPKPTTTPTTTTPTTTTPATTTPTTTTPTTTTPTTTTPTVVPSGGFGATGGFGGTSASDKRNAREFLIASLRPYFASAEDAGFLDQLGKIIDGYLQQDYDEDTISVLLPESEPYKQRFKGNIQRAGAGLSLLSPADYIQAENQYNEILKRFNLGDLAKRDTFATLIGGQVSAAELTDRVVNVYDRIRNADPALRAEIERVEGLSRGQVSDADFAKALLTGDTGANELKRKISVAEITAEARIRSKQLEEQGYLPGLSVKSAEDLQRLGVTREQAREGFERIALTQPRLTQLSEIYERETPGAVELQTELEKEQFQGMQSERRRRLTEQEQTAFMGQSGTQRLGIARRPRRSQF